MPNASSSSLSDSHSAGVRAVRFDCCVRFAVKGLRPVEGGIWAGVCWTDMPGVRGVGAGTARLRADAGAGEKRSDRSCGGGAAGLLSSGLLSNVVECLLVVAGVDCSCGARLASLRAVRGVACTR